MKMMEDLQKEVYGAKKAEKQAVLYFEKESKDKVAR